MENNMVKVGDTINIVKENNTDLDNLPIKVVVTELTDNGFITSGYDHIGISAHKLISEYNEKEKIVDDLK